MGFCGLFDKVFKKLCSCYRVSVFRSVTKQKAKKISIKGKIHLFNKNIKVGENVTLYPGVSFQGEGEIVIGNNTYIGNNTIIYSEKGYKVFIGNDVMIAGLCYIINANHNHYLSNVPMNKLGVNAQDIKIEDNVWIAANCVVAVGSKLNNGCVIGANSFVNRVIPENAIAVGSPAVVRKYRGDKQ